MEQLTIALSKGRIMKDTLKLLQETGIECSDIYEDSRKLIFNSTKSRIKFIIAKPFDIPTYVEYGVADLGIVGKDVIMEEKKDVYELVDLKFGFCRLVVAGPKERKGYPPHPRIASKYPRIAEEYFMQKGEQVEIIKLNGSVELAPIIGLSDKIVDIVSTGKTLKENNLKELEEIDKITARLIANRVSFRLKSKRINDLIKKINSVIEEGF
ncbi:MAG: phosphoribosyltransferase [Thermosediminibacterales bacterium]|nr:phosphoribosyltransferase [Thermosediminibacterales bacterium]MDK2835909.1 phosphoribosyltransferase [Thermosediminibacterales bacterium]